MKNMRKNRKFSRISGKIELFLRFGIYGILTINLYDERKYFDRRLQIDIPKE